MSDTGYTLADLAAIRRLRVAGTGEVRMSDGRSVKYRSDDELARLEAQIEAYLVNTGAIAAPATPAVRYATWDRD